MMPRRKQHWSSGFYWLGVAAAVACLVVVLASNTELFWRFEHWAFPLSWALAGAAIGAFLAYELCHSVLAPPVEAEDQCTPVSTEYQRAESEEAIQRETARV
jgi:hypothetical protein